MTPESFWSALASGRCRGFSEAGASSLNSGTRLFVLCVNCLGRVTLGTALRAVFCPQPPLHTSSKLDFTGSADGGAPGLRRLQPGALVEIRQDPRAQHVIATRKPVPYFPTTWSLSAGSLLQGEGGVRSSLSAQVPEPQLRVSPRVCFSRMSSASTGEG